MVNIFFEFYNMCEKIRDILNNMLIPIYTRISQYANGMFFLKFSNTLVLDFISYGTRFSNTIALDFVLVYL